MAFPTINAQQELNNRKILEDLQHKKQLIIQKGVQVNAQILPGAQQTSSPDIVLNTPASNLQRAARTLSNNQSFGYFIPTDSVAGNNILPVLPRFDQDAPK